MFRGILRSFMTRKWLSFEIFDGGVTGDVQLGNDCVHGDAMLISAKLLPQWHFTGRTRDIKK